MVGVLRTLGAVRSVDEDDRGIVRVRIQGGGTPEGGLSAGHGR